MTNLLTPLHNGHASIYLLNGFQEALDAYEDWPAKAPEPEIIIYGKTVRISVIIRRLIRCTDPVPDHIKLALAAIIPHRIRQQSSKPIETYSDAAFLMRHVLQLRLQGVIPSN